MPRSLHCIPETRLIRNQYVVRELWDLRLQTLSGRLDDPLDSEGDSEVFSSQQETETETEESARFSGKSLKWPRLVDTIALCYVAALLMRLPITIGDMYR